MIVEEIKEGKFILRYSDTKGKRLHKIGTNEFYGSALDLITSPYEYEEVDEEKDEDEGNSDK